MENMSSGRCSAGPHRQDNLAVVGRILDSGRLNTIYAGIDLAGLLYLKHFAGKNLGNASC
jgi:hypothetical protein